MIRSSTEGRLEAALEVLQEKLVRRKVSLKNLDAQKVEPAAKATYRQTVLLTEGIAIEKAREIVKEIKAAKLKVQAQIMDDQVRVMGKNRDDLQTVMQMLRGLELGVGDAEQPGVVGDVISHRAPAEHHHPVAARIEDDGVSIAGHDLGRYRLRLEPERRERAGLDRGAEVRVRAHRTGDHGASLTANRRALAIRERVLGAEHPDVAYSLVNVAIELGSW